MDANNDLHEKNNMFYRAFEDRFRGSRELIKSRLLVYLPFIEPLKKIYDECNAIDLGCGRGEWLELVTEAGITAHGVDLDEGMLTACQERGLSVETADAISHIKSLPDESQILVSGFHIVEHISHNDVNKLIQEALRVLKPAGLLILETPNSENITVGTSSFYLDPTHLNPIPSRLLAFLTDYYGFYRAKILRLQEPSDLMESRTVNLEKVFFGVSPDYAIVAQKRAKPGLLENFDPLFTVEYGISLEALLARYDFKEEVFKTETRKELNGMRTELNGMRTELNSIYYSRSWQITAPLRWLSLQIKLLRKDGLYVRSKAVFRRLFLRSNTQPGSSPSRRTPNQDKDSSDPAIVTIKEHLPPHTKRDLRSAQSAGLASKFKQTIRSWLVFAIKSVSNCAGKMPGIKRLAFRIMHKFPNLELMVRRYNQEDQKDGQLKAGTRYAIATNSQLLHQNVQYAGNSSAKLNSPLDGINASQRTPLEANYHTFRKNS